MSIELPTIPAGVLTLLAVFAPYAIALINSPKWSAGSKRFMSVAVSIGLALIAIVGYYLITREPLVWENWPMLVLLFVIVAQASYALVTKPSASKVEANAGVR